MMGPDVQQFNDYHVFSLQPGFFVHGNRTPERIETGQFLMEGSGSQY